MNLFDEKRPLAIDITFKTNGDKIEGRVIAELFKTPLGLAFFDVFWQGSSMNAIHFVDGEITGEGPWEITNKMFRDKIYVIEEDDRIFDEWENWQAYLAEKQFPAGQAEAVFKKELEEYMFYYNKRQKIIEEGGTV